MQRLASFDPTSGNIHQVGFGQTAPDLPGLEHIKVPDGISCSSRSHYVIRDGDRWALAAYTAEQAVVRAARPRHKARWDNAIMRYVDLRSLAEAKHDKLAELRLRRDAAELGTFTFDSNVFDCDERARARIAEVCARAMREALPTFERRWPSADGGNVLLGRAQLIALADALEDHTDAVRTRWRAVQVSVAAATTPAEVQAVVW